MKYYLIIAPLLLFCVWLYIIYQNRKNKKVFKKIVGDSFWPLRSSMKLFSTKDEENINPEFLEAYKAYKKSRLKLLSLWLFSILSIIILTIVVSILFFNIR